MEYILTISALKIQKSSNGINRYPIECYTYDEMHIHNSRFDIDFCFKQLC